MTSAVPDRAKVVVAGDPSVGKTALLSRYLFNLFSTDYNFTVGIDFHSRAVPLENDETVRLQLWDTAGQERFRALLPSYLRDCCVVVIVYDITSKKSFDGLTFWLDYVRRHTQDKSQIMVVGMKADLVHEREVSKQELIALGKKHGIVVFEASAVNGDGVQAVFLAAGRIANDVLKTKQNPHQTLDLAAEATREKRKCCPN